MSSKIFGLSMLGVLIAMSFSGVQSAYAEGTVQCSIDASPCPKGNVVNHIHLTTLSGAKAKLLTSIINVECDILFLGDLIGMVGSWMVYLGHYTLTNCGSCTVEEWSGESTIEILKTSHETALAVGEGETHVNCSGLNCYYNAEGLEGTAKGPLLSSETNGSVSIQEQTVKKVKGLFCPSTNKLDIVITPLSATYITE